MLLFITSALASSTYPDAIATELGVSCTPQCTVCHETNSGGSGTVIMEFGMAMEDRGLTGGANTSGLQTALASMTADGVDSDGDGVSDTDELIAGTDPNPGGAPFCDVLTPTYGCFNTTQRPASGMALLGALTAFVLVTRRS